MKLENYMFATTNWHKKRPPPGDATCMYNHAPQ